MGNLAEKFNLEESTLTREQFDQCPDDKAFWIEDGSIGRVMSKMDKIHKIKDIVEHAHHNFNAPLYYIPTGDKVAVKDMYCITEEMMELWNEIEEKVKDKELKNFLRIRFSQLIEIDLKKTADFFVNQTDEIKDIFEKLALVVIDYEGAMKYGFFDIADSINDTGEICQHGSYFLDKNKPTKAPTTSPSQPDT